MKPAHFAAAFALLPALATPQESGYMTVRVSCDNGNVVLRMPAPVIELHVPFSRIVQVCAVRT